MSSIFTRTNKMIALVAITLLFLIFMYHEALMHMLRDWDRPEYGHAYFIPFIAFYLIWQRRHELGAIDLKGSWWGIALIGFGSALFLLGQFSTIYIVVQYAFLITLYGLILTVLGLKAFRIMLIPLLFLAFMIPLPSFLYQGLSANLQLISSQIGVAIIRLMNISVFLEGNVIDLGAYKLQVVEACSGLKYLFSLTSIAFLCAYLFHGALWKRIVIFLSAIPITIFMNSFRIGVTGILVEYWGISHADGFLHEFEGLVIFGFAVVLLLMVMTFLARMGKSGKKLFEVFDIPQSKMKSNGGFSTLAISKPFIATVAALFLVGFTMQFATNREEQKLARKSFFSFPEKLDVWQGKKSLLGDNYLKALKLDDYILADYKNENGKTVNFYLAWYASQKAGKSAHSPRSCLPGGGWQITELTRKSLTISSFGKSSVQVNRTVIQSGDTKQLVYYWFDQRGRNLTSEYMVKWFIFWDSMVKNRSDGALIRLTTYVHPAEKISEADKRLLSFSKKIMPLLSEYVPK